MEVFHKQKLFGCKMFPICKTPKYLALQVRSNIHFECHLRYFLYFCVPYWYYKLHSVAQSICTQYSCFENMGRFATLKKNWVQNMRCKRQGTKNRVIVIQKGRKQSGGLFPFGITMDHCTLLFATLILNLLLLRFQTLKKYQINLSKISGCRLSGQMEINLIMIDMQNSIVWVSQL